MLFIPKKGLYLHLQSSHPTIQSNIFSARTKDFYNSVRVTLGAKRLEQFYLSNLNLNKTPQKYIRKYIQHKERKNHLFPFIHSCSLLYIVMIVLIYFYIVFVDRLMRARVQTTQLVSHWEIDQIYHFILNNLIKSPEHNTK